MASREKFDFETDCSIGDLEYDSDMQITRLYVKVYQRKASLKELERLFNYYRNKVLEYLDLTTAMLKFLKQAYQDTNTYRLGNYISKGFDKCSVDIIKANNIPSEVRHRVLNNFSTYFGLQSRMSEYLIEETFFDDPLEDEKKRGGVRINNVYLPGCTDNPIDISSHLTKSTYSLLIDFIIPYVYDVYNSDKFKKCSWYKFVLTEFMKKIRTMTVRNNISAKHKRGELHEEAVENIVGTEMYNSLRKEYDEDTYSEELNYIHQINDCVEMLDLIADWNCLNFKIPDLVTLIKSEFYLPNNIGLFGLNTYLWALYNGVKIVGVPSIFPQYDGIEGTCPSEFINHDILHGHNISTGGDRVSDTKSVYYRLISDTELTLQQKKLMILTM